MTKLIVRPHPDPDGEGRVLSITPESAGWEYVGFELLRLSEGQQLSRETGSQEICLVILSGIADVSTKNGEWCGIGKRMSVFERTPPYSVYVPNGDKYDIHALTQLEVAVCAAPGRGNHSARLIAPEQVGAEIRGAGSIERQVHNILPENEPADSLLVVEVFTPNGHWSSYPPHKHDRDSLPDESMLEETYYFRVQPDQGFALQRVYTDDRSLDETLVVKDGEAVLVPEGYHPVSAPPGYDVYYLNVMAGPKRTWKFHNDPDHEWIMTASHTSR
ncbi:5-deoxy-glucuronate isomerase [Paenibacillus xerothermodurans]|uniref:5-deoxy-glucuronate isomerase n=1 Tax=Paenibacillus xerothermodurans TaxID=1977292 RepID=A0A2W1NAH2_PAEXE|nr:5-deoxy-glucuronate isomerase [Paenibacillus xerothermodurans]PZE21659.1 5-deoxy-glucuronate isomerase [Paenibacillus xerothermodurans]